MTLYEDLLCEIEDIRNQNLCEGVGEASGKRAKEFFKKIIPYVQDLTEAQYDEICNQALQEVLPYLNIPIVDLESNLHLLGEI